MIVTDLAHLPAQLKTNAAFEIALDFLRREGWRCHADGTIPVDGARVYGMLQSYETKIPQATVPLEGHHKYIDIQFIIEGTEKIFWAAASGLTPTIPYDDAKDIWFSPAPPENATAVVLTAGQLAVLFPEDAHAPTHCVDAPVRVRKILMKVSVAG